LYWLLLIICLGVLVGVGGYFVLYIHQISQQLQLQQLGVYSQV
jgi:hypothetical protein